jgi:hypothetical protein
MVVFLDNLGYLLARIDIVDIGLLLGTDVHHLSPDTFDLGAFVFGSIIDLTTSPPTHLATTIWQRIQASIGPDINKHIRSFIAPPRVMVCFDILALVPHPLLVAACGSACTTSGMGSIGYHLHGYIGNLQYYFEFIPLWMRDNIILANPLDGRITCLIEVVPSKGALPPDDIDDWVAFQHEDAPSGEGGSYVTCPT